MPGWGRGEEGSSPPTRVCRPRSSPGELPRVSPAAPRSPEAGGELARGLQAGVAGGGDFILGANLPAGRKEHKN